MRVEKFNFDYFSLGSEKIDTFFSLKQFRKILLRRFGDLFEFVAVVVEGRIARLIKPQPPLFIIWVTLITRHDVSISDIHNCDNMYALELRC